jgi:hypothetical protein
VASLLYGYDPFSGKTIDVAKDAPGFVGRLKYITKQTLLGELGMPNTVKYLQEKFGMKDPETMTPAAALMLNGSFGKFMNIDNVDREYLMKLHALDKGRKAAYQTFKSAVMNENFGNTSALGGARFGSMGLAIADGIEPFTPVDAYNHFLNIQKDVVKTEAAREYLSTHKASDVAKVIEGMNQQIKELNENYVAVRKAQLIQKATEKSQPAQPIQKPDLTPSDKGDGASLMRPRGRSVASVGNEIPEGQSWWDKQDGERVQSLWDDAEKKIGFELDEDEVRDLFKNGPNPSAEDFKQARELKWKAAERLAGKPLPLRQAQDMTTMRQRGLEAVPTPERRAAVMGQDYNPGTNAAKPAQPYSLYLRSQTDPKTGKRTWQMGQEFLKKR